MFYIQFFIIFAFFTFRLLSHLLEDEFLSESIVRGLRGFIFLRPVLTKGYTARLTTFPPSFYLLIPASVVHSSLGVSLQASLFGIADVYLFLLPLSLCESRLHFSMLTKSRGTRSLRPGSNEASLLFDVRASARVLSLFLLGTSMNVYKLVSCFEFFVSQIPLYL